MTRKTWTGPSPTRSAWARKRGPPSGAWPVIPAEALRQVREPAAELRLPTRRQPPAALLPAFAQAAVGIEPAAWRPPGWLFPHQAAAARRLAGALDTFGGALLADAVGLGKTYVALALAHRAGGTTAVVPASLRHQWQRAAAGRGIPCTIVTHEALSRGARVPPSAFVVVDEAHRFRNPGTRRYDRLARDIRARPVLLLTATPVVNGVPDLYHLLRLFLPDHALAGVGIPSLERHLVHGVQSDLWRSAVPLIVARTGQQAGVEAAVPRTRDAPVIRASPVPDPVLPAVLAAIDALRFPSFDRDAGALLRRHLVYRLASSAAACAETAARHLHWCERAHRAAARGERLSRGEVRLAWHALAGTQLEFAFPTPAAPLPTERFEREQTRLETVARLLRDGMATSPKSEALRALLRPPGRVLVFTAARATAVQLAEALAWRRVGVVASGGARIASGPVPVRTALALFAPSGQGCPAPAAAARLDVLIATDLASEGLNLQDAGMVVHYDLPWNAQRLAQRVGRVARLGSRHPVVSVAWFQPVAALERRLTLAPRIRRKLRAQFRAATPASSRVGRSYIPNRDLEARERFIGGVRGDPSRGFARVDGPPRTGAWVIRWELGGRAVREIAAQVEGAPCRHFMQALGMARSLAGGRADPTGRPELPADLRRALVRRLVVADLGPTDRETRRLSRRILRLARHAGRERDRGAIALLDAALGRLRAGTTAGECRNLADVLSDAPAGLSGLAGWVRETPRRARTWIGPTVEACLTTGGSGTDATRHQCRFREGDER